jgi:hypothetical protein
VSREAAKFSKQQWLETIKYPWTTYKDPDLRRQFQKHSVLGYAALDADKHEKVPHPATGLEVRYNAQHNGTHGDGNRS